MADIEQFIDVDLHTPPEGQSRGLGPLQEQGFGNSIQLDKDYLNDLQDFGNVYGSELIPMSEWSNYEDAWRDLRSMVKMIFNQAQEPSCASNSQAQCMQTRGFYQYGDDFVKLSAASLYHRVRLRGGGSFISDNMKQTINPGILPLDNEENRARFKHCHPARGESKLLPGGWKDTAKYFQVEGWLRVSTPEEWFTSLIKCFPINYGRDGHAIASIYPKKIRGNWSFCYANSWNYSWGDDGFGCDSLRKISSCTGYAVQSITTYDQAEPIALHESQSETLIA